jgi:hypothetical protein
MYVFYEAFDHLQNLTARIQTARIRPTDYAVTERHIQALLFVLSEGTTHNTSDQVKRFAIDVVSDIF